MENASEKLLRTIGLSPDLVKLHNQYYEEMFHNMVEFKIKKMLRDRHFLLVADMYSSVRSDSTILEISSKFGFNHIDHSLFNRLLRKIMDGDFVRSVGGGKFVKSTRKLVAKIYTEKEIDIHQRIIYYISDIAKTVLHNRLDCILNKAVLYAEKIKHRTVFEAKEPWRVAVILSLIIVITFLIVDSLI